MDSSQLAATPGGSRFKRKWEESEGPNEVLPTKLQTTGLKTSDISRFVDASGHEGDLSPRTMVSASFQSLNLQTTDDPTSRMSPSKRPRRRTSWTVPLAKSGTVPSFEEEIAASGHKMNDCPSPILSVSDTNTEVLEIPESPQPSSLARRARLTSSLSPRPSQDEHDRQHAVFHFGASNGQDQVPSTPPVSEMQRSVSPTPDKAAAASSNPQDHPDPTKTPSRSHRHKLLADSVSSSTSKSSPQVKFSTPAQPVTTTATALPITRLTSPSPHSSTSTISSQRPDLKIDTENDDDTENDGQDLWWQDEEITGHDPTDPEDDLRGVNGIGYQKTKAEQNRINEKKKRQINEWRNREAREARAIRAAGRLGPGGAGSGRGSESSKVDKADLGHRIMLGRVTKSRSGSPVERRDRDKDRERQTGGKGVRFE